MSAFTVQQLQEMYAKRNVIVFRLPEVNIKEDGIQDIGTINDCVPGLHLQDYQITVESDFDPFEDRQ